MGSSLEQNDLAPPIAVSSQMHTVAIVLSRKTLDFLYLALQLSLFFPASSWRNQLIKSDPVRKLFSTERLGVWIFAGMPNSDLATLRKDRSLLCFLSAFFSIWFNKPKTSGHDQVGSKQAFVCRTKVRRRLSTGVGVEPGSPLQKK